MDEALRKPDWIPYYIQRMKSSDAWQLPDYQFCWYWKLLTEAADSPIPGYLPGSLDELWRLAGAKSKENFIRFGGPALISRFFKRTETHPALKSEEDVVNRGGPLQRTGVGQAWIYNPRMLEVLHEQMTKLTKRRRRCISSLSLSIQELPEWIPEESFKEFMSMREKIKKPLTGHALKLAVSKLEKLKAEGHEPKAVLEQSIFNSWQGLFPIAQVTDGLRGRAGTNMAGAPSNGNGRPPEKKSTIDPECETCGGTGFDLSSGKAVPCPCRKRQESSKPGAINGSGAERPMPNVASPGRDFKAAGANDR